MAQDQFKKDYEEWRDTSADDRRADARYLAAHWIAKLVSGGAHELCVVHSICSTGLVAHVFVKHDVGERVRIALRGGAELDGDVVWSNDEQVELRFLTTVDASALVGDQAQAEHGRPGLPRLDISATAELRLQGQAHTVEVRDLSQGGVKIQTDATPRLGEPAVLAIEGLGDIEGTVRWCENGHLGIAFLQPIPFDALTKWIVARDEKDHENAATRRWPRYNMFLKSWMQLSGVHTPVEIYIHNLCRGGLMATCKRGLHPGENVVVALGRAGEVEGSVVWTDDEHAGICFSRTLEPDHARHPFASRSVAPLFHHQGDGRRPGLKIH